MNGGASTDRDDLFRQSVQRRGASCRQDDVVPGPGEEQRQASADAGRCPGDQYGLRGSHERSLPGITPAVPSLPAPPESGPDGTRGNGTRQTVVVRSGPPEDACLPVM